MIRFERKVTICSPSEHCKKLVTIVLSSLLSYTNTVLTEQAAEVEKTPTIPIYDKLELFNTAQFWNIYPMIRFDFSGSYLLINGWRLEGYEHNRFYFGREHLTTRQSVNFPFSLEVNFMQ